MPNQKFSFLGFILLITCICASSCSSNKNLVQNKNSIDTESKILFLNYMIKKTINGIREIEFINKKIATGKAKQNPFTPIENGIKGDLVFTELNKKKKVISQGLIKNPLVKKMEYVDESKHFKTKVIDFDEMQFSIRLQLKNTTKIITISNFGETEPLISTQIQ